MHKRQPSQDQAEGRQDLRWERGQRSRPGGLGCLVARTSHMCASALTVNRELVRKARGKAPLVVHSCMERDVGLLRLYPGIPAALVGNRPSPARPPRSPCTLWLPGTCLPILSPALPLPVTHPAAGPGTRGTATVQRPSAFTAEADPFRDRSCVCPRDLQPLPHLLS